MKKILLVALLSIISFAKPTFINFQVTNSTVLGYLESGITQENIKLRGSYLYNDNSNKHNFYSVGLKAEGNLIGMEKANIKFSILSDFVHTKNNSAVALGFGLFSFIPQINLPIFVQGEFEYAPKVLSFDDADRFSRVDVSVGYFPIESGNIFVGYRNISFNSNYNSSVYFGVGYSF